tara:strand:+ start:2363 stop:2818 length:456 start_codon:yes stop_codon:yes gene_type:complete
MSNIVHKSLLMVHTVSYDSRHLESQVENLIKLRESDYNRIKIPNFEFNVYRNVLTIHMDYIKGKQITLEKRYLYKDIIYEDLVCSKNPVSVLGYTLENFIISKEDKQIYFIDLTDIGVSTISQRKRQYNIDWVLEKPEIGLSINTGDKILK